MVPKLAAKLRKGDTPEDTGKLTAYVLHNWHRLVPTARDWKGGRTAEGLKRAGRTPFNTLPDFINTAAGATGPLNPRFVAEMMGFPPDWTELPFRSGAIRA